MLTKRLLWQLYSPFMLIIVLSVAGVGWYGAQSLRSFHEKQVSDDLEARAHLIEEQISSHLAEGQYEWIDHFCKQIGAASITRITVILPNGGVIGDSDEQPAQMKNHANRPEFQDAIKNGRGRSTRFSNTLNKKMMYLAIPVFHNEQMIAVVRTSFPVTAIDEALDSIHKKIFWSVLIISLGAAVVSLALSKRISMPVEQMTAVAHDFASGNLDRRLSLPDSLELAELAKTLNEMARQLSSRIETITKERGQIQAILSSMVEGVLAVDASGRIVSVNRAAGKLLSINADNSRGLLIEEVIRNPQFQQYIRKVIKEPEFSAGEGLVLNEGNRILQLYGSCLSDANGNNNGAVLVLHDITRTRRLEEVRRDFVANVSHELKTPVTSIKGFVETLLDGAIDEPEQVRRFLEIIARHSDRLNAIIEDLLSLSRLEADSDKRELTFEMAGIRPILLSAIELSKLKAEEKQVTVELQCDESIQAQVNAPLVEQAVLNLVDNAVKYSKDGSRVKVHVRRVNGEVVIEVSDQGCGIEQEHLARIFERFYVVDKGRSRKLGGTGLGLSIVKHIAQVHCGHVEVESVVGQGTAFKIYLPATPNNEQNS